MSDTADDGAARTTLSEKEPPKSSPRNDEELQANSLATEVVTNDLLLPNDESCKEEAPRPTTANRKRKLVSSDLSSPKEKSVATASAVDQSNEVDIEPRKKYFISGLYVDSETFSTNEISVLEDKVAKIRAEVSSGDVKFQWPQPIEFGKVLLNKNEDFCLPYDVWWLMKHGKLRNCGSFSKLPKDYKAIRNNVYVDIRVPNASEASACVCKLPASESEMGCKEDCLNRVVFTECSPEHCPCGEKCSNQRFRKRQWAPGLKKIMTKDRGYGVITTTDLKAGQFLIEYVGEVISEQLYRERVATQYRHQHDHYCLSLEGGIIIDGHNMGSLARFVNHSCNPNCEMQKWCVNGAYHMGLFTLKDIPANTELNYDYNFDAMDNDFQKCFCHSENCRGVIGAKNGSVGMKSKLGNIAFFNRRPGTKRKLGDLRGDVVCDKLRSKLTEIKSQSSTGGNSSAFELPLYRPMTLKERTVVCERRLFLCRNLTLTVEHFSLLLEILRDQESKMNLSLANELSSVQQESTVEREVIRCICGIPVEDGLMIQCDKCNVWQHCDCMDFYPPEDSKTISYLCEKCSYRKVDRDIPLKPQPADGVQGCTYYLTFWHNGQLIRKESCAYTSRDHALTWKNGKKRSCNRRLRMNHQEELDVFRIVALWQTDTFERFAYGFHYFRPKEVPRVEGQRFYPNEVFETKLFEVVPLEAVISPCVVMDRFSYVRGRPVGFEEKDVYVCVMSYNSKSQKTEPVKRKKIQYPICQDPSVFIKFSQPLRMRKTVLADPNDVASSKRPTRNSEKDQHKISVFQMAPEDSTPLGPGDEINRIAELLSVERHRRLKKKGIVDASGLLYRRDKKN